MDRLTQLAHRSHIFMSGTVLAMPLPAAAPTTIRHRLRLWRLMPLLLPLLLLLGLLQLLCLASLSSINAAAAAMNASGTATSTLHRHCGRGWQCHRWTTSIVKRCWPCDAPVVHMQPLQRTKVGVRSAPAAAAASPAPVTAMLRCWRCVVIVWGREVLEDWIYAQRASLLARVEPVVNTTTMEHVRTWQAPHLLSC
jgi:hypothetical protein